MNIFYLDSDAKKCAEQHMDRHVVKMILEYAQLLSTAHRVLDGEELKLVGTDGFRSRKIWILPDEREDFLYKTTHVNHPSAVWARASRENYVWLWSLLNELCKEYTFRYGKIHKTEASGLVKKLKTPPKNISRSSFTQPTPAMPDEYVSSDSIEAYRTYYKADKARLARWSKREIPSWWDNE
jgi:hypothetical protein